MTSKTPGIHELIDMTKVWSFNSSLSTICLKMATFQRKPPSLLSLHDLTPFIIRSRCFHYVTTLSWTYTGLRTRLDFFGYLPRNEKGIRKFYRVLSPLCLNYVYSHALPR